MVLLIELLLEFPLEPVPYVDGIRSPPDVVTPVTPPNKCNILKGESIVAYFLGIILDARYLKIGFESPKVVIGLPSTPSPMEGRRPRCIPLWSRRYLDDSTICHRDHVDLQLGFKSLLCMP